MASFTLATNALPQDAQLLARYETQVAGYLEAVRQMYPHKPVRAMLVFSSGDTLEIATA
jgi:ATP-dependent exoDNAse (exonuclease V) beta subunit